MARRRRPRLVQPEGPQPLPSAFAECVGGCTWKWTSANPLEPEAAATDHTQRTGHPTFARWPKK